MWACAPSHNLPTPISPPSGPAQRLAQGPPVRSKFLAATYILDGSGYLVPSGGGGNTAPTISDITDLSVPSGGNTGALAFTVGDAETAVGSLAVTGSSSNTTLVLNGNIVFGGSGASRTVTITPVSGLSGAATITVTVTDAGSLTASDTFVLTVTDNYLSWSTANGGNWLGARPPFHYSSQRWHFVARCGGGFRNAVSDQRNQSMDESKAG